MVKYNEETLDRTFAALADPTGGAVARLGRRETLSVSELAQPFAMSLPAIMKHSRRALGCGLIAREKTGRIVACRLTAKPMEQAMIGSIATSASGPTISTASPLSWRKTNGPAIKRRRCCKTEPQLQAPPQREPEKVYAAWTDPEKIVRWFGRVDLKPRP